jgi:RNA 3'-terminal phosphate cyclase (ATP)
MIEIDGSFGEGGGQIIRTSLSLSLITGKPFSIKRVRANRDKPGLQRQHLTAVLAAAEVGQANVTGAAVGSCEFKFTPGNVTPGRYRFAIGTAGSTTLVLQTLLPPLMLAGGPSHLTLEGGTHNPKAPPFEFLQNSFVPLINRIGPKVDLELKRYGFYPPGGGKLEVSISPATKLTSLHLSPSGQVSSRHSRALVVKLPRNVAERELNIIRERLGFDDSELSVDSSENAISPGNVLTVSIEREQLTEVITALGRRGVPAERVALEAANETEAYLAHGAPVGEHLADQLLLPMALAGGGYFTTGPLSLHTTTNIEIIKKFLDVSIGVRQVGEAQWEIRIEGN